MKSRVVLRVLIFIAIFFGNQCDYKGIERPNSFWENLSGEWRLNSTYTVNHEEFDVPVCDQLTVIKFDTLNETQLERELPSETYVYLPNFFKIRNNSCDENFLFFGPLLSRLTLLPHTTDFSVNFSRACNSCKFYDVHYSDLESCVTDSTPFSVILLTDQEFHVRYLANYFNRYVNNQFVLDTVELRFSRSGAGDIQTVQPFKINDYNKRKWIHFDGTLECGKTGNVSVVPGGIDSNCVYLADQVSSICTDMDLKNTIGQDNKITLSFWLKPDGLDKSRQIFYSKYSNTYGPFVFYLKYDKIVVAVNNGAGQLKEIETTKSLKSGEWNHLCFSYNSQELLICIDGKSDSRQRVNSFLNDANGNPQIGNAEILMPDQISPQGFKGYIDEIIIFEDYLSQGEVFQLFQWHLTN